MTNHFIPEFKHETDSMEALLECEDSFVSVASGDIVQGEVVRIKNGEFFVSIGNKIDGIVAQKDMRSLSEEALAEVKVGTLISVCVINTGEDHEGIAELSVDVAKAEDMWLEMEKVYDKKESTIGKVHGFNKGGMMVDLGGINGFVPLSHVGDGKIILTNSDKTRALEQRVGENVELDIIEIDRSSGRLVLSERSVLAKKKAKMKELALQNLAPGKVMRGHVKNITSFGAFIDIGGLEGLVHISELSWARVDHPSDVVSIGQEVEVEILDVDRDKERVSLSMRRLHRFHWEDILTKYEEGQIITVTITQLLPFGAFARIEDGVEGLIHISECSTDHISHPKEIVNFGDVVTVKILGIDNERKRITLSMRQAEWRSADAIVWQG